MDCLEEGVKSLDQHFHMGDVLAVIFRGSHSHLGVYPLVHLVRLMDELNDGLLVQQPLLLSSHLGSEPLKVVAELVHPLLDVVAVKVTSLGHALAGNL